MTCCCAGVFGGTTLIAVREAAIVGFPLNDLIARIAEIYPCNVLEIAIAVGKEAGISDVRSLSDVASAVMYVLNQSEGGGDGVADIVSDLQEIKLVDEKSAKALAELLDIGNKLHDTAEVIDAYRKLGLPVLEDISGTVDVRYRFHRTAAEFMVGGEAREVVDVRPRIVVDIELRDESYTGERRFSFQMDEHDLRMFRRFVELMEAELQLVIPLIRQHQPESET